MTILTSSHFFSESSATHCSLCLFPPVYHSYVSSRHCIVFPLCFLAPAKSRRSSSWGRSLKTRSYRCVTLQNVTEVPFQFPCCAPAAPLGERHHLQSPPSALPGPPECVCLDSTDKDADSNLFSDRLTDDP